MILSLCNMERNEKGEFWLNSTWRSTLTFLLNSPVTFCCCKILGASVLVLPTNCFNVGQLFFSLLEYKIEMAVPLSTQLVS
ncbi:hypothetical protein ACB092_11G197400 [Castanea dentata]